MFILFQVEIFATPPLYAIPTTPKGVSTQREWVGPMRSTELLKCTESWLSIYLSRLRGRRSGEIVRERRCCGWNNQIILLLMRHYKDAVERKRRTVEQLPLFGTHCSDANMSWLFGISVQVDKQLEAWRLWVSRSEWKGLICNSKRINNTYRVTVIVILYLFLLSMSRVFNKPGNSERKSVIYFSAVQHLTT